MYKSLMRVNDELEVKLHTQRNRTRICLYENGVEKVLSDVRTWDGFWSKVEYNEYYIIAYSHGCMANQIPLSIDAAYSIQEKRLLTLSPKLEELLENMLVSKKGFGFAQVLQAINEVDLQIIRKRKSNELVNYLTAGNPNISKQQVVEYILGCYPEFKKYTNFKGTLSVLKFEKLKLELGANTYFFHIIPQELLKLPEVTG